MPPPLDIAPPAIIEVDIMDVGMEPPVPVAELAAELDATGVEVPQPASRTTEATAAALSAANRLIELS